MRPAREGLDADEPASRYMHLRLELEREGAVVERLLQLLRSKTDDGHRRLRLRPPTPRVVAAPPQMHAGPSGPDPQLSRRHRGTSPGAPARARSRTTRRPLLSHPVWLPPVQ